MITIHSLPKTRSEIAALIPHQGTMCLIEHVLYCDAERIHCTSRSHLNATHPLLHQGRLAAVHLCEYGAQATAIHGALLSREAGTVSPPGLLVALREVKLATTYLDECQQFNNDQRNELQITAIQLQTSKAGCVYEFAVSMAEQQLVTGKVTIMTILSP